MYFQKATTEIDVFLSRIKHCEYCDVLSFIFGPQGVLPNKEVGGGGGLGPHIKFGGKIWGKVRPSSPNKRKNLRRSVTTGCKSWEKSQFLGHI